ncbi:MAG: DMT family transporter [Ruminococcaceae bacterium]|nr:DMT family transporter [Oscillospiraceae bacterium]
MKSIKYIICAVLAAALYALNAPFSKILLTGVEPRMMAAMLYLGAGVGTFIVLNVKKLCFGKRDGGEKLERRDMPYVLGMIFLDIAAPVFLMMGLMESSAANASLLNNFEIVATSLIAFVLFREKIGRRLWAGILLVTLSSMILSFEDVSAFSFSRGSLFVILACVCWGFENNCTRSLSNKDPIVIVVIKGIFSGLGAFITAIVSGESLPGVRFVIPALLLGFVAYGLSIVFYIYAQRGLGAARTSAYYAVAPFIGAALSFAVLSESLTVTFGVGLAVMMVGTWLVTFGQKE